MKFFQKFLYIFIRIIIASFAIFLSYLLVSKVIEPKLLRKACLTDSGNCYYIDIYKYKNSFVAKESTTGLWFWFNGSNLYVYGIAPGTCREDSYEPVFKITIDTSTGQPQFLSEEIECVTKLQSVIDYYTKTQNVSMRRLYFHSDNQFFTIYDIINTMFEKKLMA